MELNPSLMTTELVTTANQSASAQSHRNKRIGRVSLACLQCRNSHLRCDASTPVCLRCMKEGRNCFYPKSRRGGQRSCKNGSPEHGINSSTRSCAQLARKTNSYTAAPISINVSQAETPLRLASAENASCVSDSSDERDQSVDSEHLIHMYYTFFHDAHPFILPEIHLIQRSKAHPEQMRPLIAAIHYVGSKYSNSNTSPQLRTTAIDTLSTSCKSPNGFIVQGLLLLTISLYWSDDVDLSQRLFALATQVAIDLGMNQRGFAVSMGEGNEILTESWRRTFWLLYATDFDIAASTNCLPQLRTDLEITVELPCEDHEYASGKVPVPKTLEEFDLREFQVDGTNFSSFAYLIGMYRGLARYVFQFEDTVRTDVMTRCELIDTFLAGYLLLLPKSKQEILSDDGCLDKLMFQVHLLAQTVIICIHRPLSEFVYDPLERLSRCGTLHMRPYLSTRGCKSNIPHCLKILNAFVEMNRIMQLSRNLLHHNPFIICMFAVTTIAQLSACKYLLKGNPLVIARDRIRATIGVLSTIENAWSLGARTVREMKLIARKILDLDNQITSRDPESIPEIDFTTNLALDRAELYPELDFADFLQNVQDIDLDATQDDCLWNLLV